MEKQHSKFVRQIPNGLTTIRLVLTVVFLAMILYAPRLHEEKPWRYLMAAFSLFVIAGITDMVDGMVARALNATSKFGRIVDPLADKILVVGAFICFAIIGQPRLANFEFSETWMGIFHWTAAGALTIRELGVTILRHIAESRGVAFGAAVSGKIKMFVQSFGIGTVLVGWAFVSRPWGDWFTLITYILMVIITIYSGIESFLRPIRPETQSSPDEKDV